MDRVHTWGKLRKYVATNRTKDSSCSSQRNSNHWISWTHHRQCYKGIIEPQESPVCRSDSEPCDAQHESESRKCRDDSEHTGAGISGWSVTEGLEDLLRVKLIPNSAIARNTLLRQAEVIEGVDSATQAVLLLARAC